MKGKRALPTQRRDHLENRPAVQFEVNLARSNEKFRNSVAIDYRLAQRESSQGWNRYSVNIGWCGKGPRSEEGSPSSIAAMQSIRNTLNQLQLRIDSAKEELRGNLILGRSVIEQQEQEESRTLDLISFNDSQHSRPSEENKGIPSKKQKRPVELVDLGRVKSYYKNELAKIFTSANPRAKDHLVHSWKVLNAYRSTCDPNPEITPKRAAQISELPPKKCLVIGLDGALIHCVGEQQAEEDIEIHLPGPKGVKQTFFLSIRPHAISFLKKMGKKFEIVVFSNRSREETDAILEELDPLGQLVTLRLYRDSCHQVGDLHIKDLRVLKRDLSSVILVDSSPESYLHHLNNAVPLLPFSGGPDSELYSLEKYLEELGKAKDVREPNAKYFSLMRYGEWEQPLQGVKELYFARQ